MKIRDSKIKTFAHKKLNEHFKLRANNPPYDALPWSSAWIEYVGELRELERQLTEGGERL